MKRTSMTATLALLFIGLGACGDASDRTRSGAGSTPVGALLDGAAIGTAPDTATDAPHSPNRMHIGRPLPAD